MEGTQPSAAGGDGAPTANLYNLRMVPEGWHHTRGLGGHTECALSYGSGAWGLGSSSNPWIGYRGDDAEDGMQDQLAKW